MSRDAKIIAIIWNREWSLRINRSFLWHALISNINYSPKPNNMIEDKLVSTTSANGRYSINSIWKAITS